MRKTFFFAATLAIMASCSNGGQTCNCDCAACQNCENKGGQAAVEAVDAVIVDNEQYDLAQLKQDEEGYYILFDGSSLDGWRGYGQDAVPQSWENDGESIHLKGSGTGEAQAEGGGDLMFAHKFTNFTLELEYKINLLPRSGGKGCRRKLPAHLAELLRVSGAGQCKPCGCTTWC